MRSPSITEDAKKITKRAAKLGVFLAVVCHLVPPEYREICNALADLCTLSVR